MPFPDRDASATANLLDLARDGEDVAGSRRLGPADPSRADDAACERKATLRHQTHGDGRRVPATRGETRKQRELGRLIVEMERLWVELASEGFDLRLVEPGDRLVKRCPTLRSSR